MSLTTDIQKLFKKTFSVRLKFTWEDSVFAGSDSSEIPGMEISSNKRLSWDQVLPSKWREGFELYDEVEVIEPRNPLFGKKMFVMGWHPYPDFIQILLADDKDDDYKVRYGIESHKIRRR